MSGKDKVPGAALLWDESFLWGLMAYKALNSAGLPFELIRAEDVRRGCLERYSALFVPGGWASNKQKALGSEGIEAIKRFVSAGGSYLGFCGGAGLATMDGIGLVPVKRRPTKERVPSFSGRIGLNIHEHPMWGDNNEYKSTNSELATPNSRLVFNAWWPSQFVIDGSVTALATYDKALPDAFSSDVNVGDAKTVGNWDELERIYQINLDPKRLTGEPAVIEGSYGKGTVLLSLVHFDTPGDTNGGEVLKNLWRYFTGSLESGLRSSESCSGNNPILTQNNLSQLEKAISGLIELGERNFLWYWRNSMLLQWRRGVRGLEYNTLYIMIQEIVHNHAAQVSEGDVERISKLLLPFVEKSGQLLVRERFAMQNNHITYERCDDPEIRALREELFSTSKSHGGKFKELVDVVDGQLYSLLKASR